MKRSKFNSLIVVFLLVLSSTLNIVDYYFNVNNLVISVMLIVILFGITLLTNKLKVNKQALFLMIIFICFYAVNAIFVDYKEIVTTEFLKMFVFGILVMFISSNKIDFKILSKSWNIVAIFFFIIMHLLLNDVTQRNFSYMHLGFINNFIFAGFIIRYFEKKNVLLIILMIYLLIISVLFGHRGSVLVNVTMFIFFLYRTLPYKKIYISSLTIISILFVYLFTIGKDLILNFLYGIQKLFPKLDSYTLKKVIRDFEKGDLDSSGRDEIYSMSLKMIEDKNYLFPNGFGYFRHVSGVVFPHNIILDIYIIFGFLSVIFMIYLCLTFYNTKMKVSKYKYNIVSLIGIYSIFRLLSGGSFIEETSFWIFIGLMLGLNTKNIISYNVKPNKYQTRGII